MSNISGDIAIQRTGCMMSFTVVGHLFHLDVIRVLNQAISAHAFAYAFLRA